jgi:hypothetical protein
MSGLIESLSASKTVFRILRFPVSEIRTVIKLNLTLRTDTPLLESGMLAPGQWYSDIEMTIPDDSGYSYNQNQMPHNLFDKAALQPIKACASNLLH